MKLSLLGLVLAIAIGIAIGIGHDHASGQVPSGGGGNTSSIANQGAPGSLPWPVTTDLSAAVTNPPSTLTLPATTTAYSAGQLIASSATAGSVVVPSFAIANSAGGAAIPRLRLSTNDTTSTAWPNVQVQVDLWVAAPMFTNGDRGIWLPATGALSHLAAFTCGFPNGPGSGAPSAWGDGLATECFPQVGNFPLPKLASGTSIFWSLQAVTATGVTGASKVFTLIPEIQN
jgi:hypothetical protein